MSMKAYNKVLTGMEQAITEASIESECWIFRNRGHNEPKPTAKALVNWRPLRAYDWSQVPLGGWYVLIIQSFQYQKFLRILWTKQMWHFTKMPGKRLGSGRNLCFLHMATIMK